jgi:hypothetical protein
VILLSARGTTVRHRPVCPPRPSRSLLKSAFEPHHEKFWCPGCPIASSAINQRPPSCGCRPSGRRAGRWSELGPVCPRDLHQCAVHARSSGPVPPYLRIRSRGCTLPRCKSTRQGGREVRGDVCLGPHVALPAREKITNSQPSISQVRDVVNSSRSHGSKGRSCVHPRRSLSSVDRDDPVCPTSDLRHLASRRSGTGEGDVPAGP